MPCFRQIYTLPLIYILLFSCFARSENLLNRELVFIDFETQKPLPISEFKNHILYVDFWASWCVPCRDSFPFMNQLSQEFENDAFRIIAVNLDTNKQDATAFLADYPARFTLAADPNKTLTNTLGVKGLPTAFLFDQQGQLVQRFVGFNRFKAAKVKSEILALIRRPTTPASITSKTSSDKIKSQGKTVH